MENRGSERHRIEDCPLPNYLTKCTDCLVTSFEGRGHASSCTKMNPITSINMDIYAEKPLPLFKIKIDNPRDEIYAFNKMIGQFKVMSDKTFIHAHEVNSIFGIRTNEENKLIDIDSTELYRFSVAVAYHLEGAWRLRYRIVVTHTDGVIYFPLRTTMEEQKGLLQMPCGFSLNTTLIIGIKASENESTVKLRVYAGGFNGSFYYGSIKFDCFYDNITPSDCLVAKKNTNIKRFWRQLYKSIPHCQREDVQRFKFDDSWCQNCSADEELLDNFRSDVYAKCPMPMSIFTMCIENLEDVTYVLNKETGTFEKIENESILHAHKINGVFRLGNNCIDFNGTSCKTFEFLIAYNSNGIFSLKYGVLAQGSKITIQQTPQQNLEMNDANMYRIPLNTALVVGIVPAADSSTINFGSYGKVIWHGDDPVAIIQTEIDQYNQSNIDGNSIDNGKIAGAMEDPSTSKKEETIPLIGFVASGLSEGM